MIPLVLVCFLSNYVGKILLDKSGLIFEEWGREFISIGIGFMTLMVIIGAIIVVILAVVVLVLSIKEDGEKFWNEVEKKKKSKDKDIQK